MAALVKKCLLNGIGWSIFKAPIGLVLCWLPILAYSQLPESPGIDDWIVIDTGPYMFELAPKDLAPRLIVIEQRGVDLKGVKSDGSSFNSPVGRNGPEFVYVAAGESSTLSLEPVYQKVAKGSFRIHALDLSEPHLVHMAKELDLAGFEAGQFSQQYILSACNRYGQLANDERLDDNWRWIVSVLLAHCNLDSGVQSSEQQITKLLGYNIDQLLENYSLLPYQANWLAARHFFTHQAYENAELEFQKALEASQLALAVVQPATDFIVLDIAEIYINYGDNGMMLAWKVGKGNNQWILSRSRDRIEKAIAIGKDFKDSLILGNAYNKNAGILFVQGRNYETIDYMKLSEIQLARVGDIESHNSVLGNMGDYYRRWGQLRAAQNAYNKATANIATVSDIGNHGFIYKKLGSLNLLFLDYEAAIHNTQAAIDFHQSAGEGRSEHEAISQLATIYREQGRLKKARDNRLRALNYFEQHQWTTSTLMAKAELSQDERLLGNTTHAYQFSLDVINLLQDSNFEIGIDPIPIYANHAQLLFELGREVEAIQQLQNALAEVKNSGAEPADEILLLATFIDLYQQLGQTADAVNMADDAFDLIESQRAEFDTVRLGPLWSARTNNIYASHIEHLLQQRQLQPEYLQRAFLVAERARTVSLRQRRQEMMLNNNEENQTARAEWVDIVSQLQQSQGEISTEEDRLAFERRFNQARERYFAAHGLSEQVQAPELLNSEQLRSLIPRDSMVLQYMEGPEKVWRFNLSENHFSVTEVGESELVSAIVESALQDIRDPKIDKRENLRLLSEILLKDVSLGEGVSRILISPTGKLDSVPFASLYYDEQYLTQAATLTMVPSLSEYFSVNLVSADSDRLEIAVLADPVFEQPSISDNYEEQAEQFRSWSSTRQRLPYSAREARELAQFFAEEDRLILTGADATQGNFFSSPVRNARIIHIATHGYFNEELPELVGLAMAKTDDQDDGFVSLAEIAAQNFSAELVVISACDTGRGFEVPGEGALSLSRSFLAQGVDSVISTLWPVSDAATAIFMKEFYRSLREDMLDPAESLQKAQHAMRRNPRYRNPFYWGAYVLTSAIQQQ